MVHAEKLIASLLIAAALFFGAPLAGSGAGVLGVQAAQAQTVSRITVSGNVRVGETTIISFLTIRVGDAATRDAINTSTNNLLDSGLFSSASVTFGGGTLRVTVAENPIVASVLFEGNQRFSDAELASMVDSGSRGTFTEDRLQNDVQSIQLAYDRQGFVNVTVTYETEILENSRVRIRFIINEGERTGIGAINFTGNNNVRADQLKGVIGTKESHLLSWLFRDDNFDEDRLAVDSELIRLYYANHGYPDAQVISHVAEFDASKNAYFINFTIAEGERYEFGQIGIETSIPDLNTDALKGEIGTYEGNRYSFRNLQSTAEDLAVAAASQGYSFADVRPRVDRDIANRRFNITYLVDEGARVYIERINITGNTKTRDFVVRRELEFAEGDPFNRTFLSRGKAAIEKLDFFAVVNISTEQGSAPDKVVINIALEEKSTGDYGATVGYSTVEGVLGEVSLTERNFLGRGQYLKVSVGASQSGRTYNFSFTEPRFMGLRIAAGVDIYKRINDETATGFYGTDSTGGQVRISLPVSNEISVTAFTGYETTAYADISPTDSALIANGAVRSKAFVGYTLGYRNVDDERNPTSGLAATFTQQYVGLDNNYVKSEAKARYYMPLLEDGNMVASVRGQVGVINDLSGGGVHPTESFMPGSNLVRGFQGRGMGPRLASGEALGTTFYAGLSTELEFPLPVFPETYGLRGAVWADVGFIGDPSAAAPAATAGITQQVRASIGASLIWNSPFGPLRGDFAHVIQQDTADKTQVFQLTLSTLL